CLSIVLEAVSFSDAVQCVDEFSITIEQDMAVGWVRPAVNSSEICGLNGVPLQVVLRNLSARPKTFISDTVAVRVCGAANRSYLQAYSNTLAAFASDTLVMDSAADFSVQGDYFVEVCCQSVDDNPANDTLRDSVRVDAGFSIDSVSVVSAQGVIVQGGSFRCGFRIRNTGNTAIAYPKVVLEINEDIRWSAKLPFCLGAGDSVWFDIAEPISVPAVSSDQPFFMLILSVSQPCVADTCVQQSLFEVFLPDSASLGLACFLYPLPSDTLVYGSKVVPRVRILNDGNVAVRSLPVSLRLYDGERMPYDSVTCFLSYLLEKDTVDFTFPSGCKVPSGSSRCLLQVFIPSLDSNAADDTLEVWCPIRMVTDTTAVPDWKGCGWQLGQNIPNPAAGRTLVPVTLPEAGAVRLQLFAADGRLLYRCELELPSGKSLLPLETGRYASGVYFYSVEYKGERKVRKMQVVE
ncbi:MAG: T9SS type A sorting domain-containing protein, partial [Bacteroidales bacterium]|nr:T9SS type A sorting domain-containing protein [Bacteroidales bacterium]